MKDVYRKLERFRKRRLILRIIEWSFLLLIPIIFFVPENSRLLFGVIIIMALFIGGLSRSLGIHTMDCPFCGKQFHIKRGGRATYFYNSYARKCAHCGLKLNGSNIDELVQSATDKT